MAYHFTSQTQWDQRTKRQPPTRQMAQDIDEISSSSSSSPDWPMRQGHQRSNNVKHSLDDELYQEQLLLEKELRNLKLNGYSNVHSEGSHFTSQIPVNDCSNGFSKNQSVKALRTNFGKNSQAPQLLSDDSLDREVEGLLDELCTSQDVGHKPFHHSAHVEDRNVPMKSLKSGARFSNGASMQPLVYHMSVSREPALTFDKQKPTPPYPSVEQPLPNKLPLERVARPKPPVIVVTNDQEAAKEFLAVRKVEQFLSEKIKLFRQYLEQKLDEVTRQEVEEQYFDAQEELCRVEKTLIYLCSFLTRPQVNWLLRHSQVTSRYSQDGQPVVPVYQDNFPQRFPNGNSSTERFNSANVNQNSHVTKYNASKVKSQTERKTVPDIKVTNGELERTVTDETLLFNSRYNNLLHTDAAVGCRGQILDVASSRSISNGRLVHSDKQTQTIMNQHTQTESEPRDGTFSTTDNHYHSEVQCLTANIFDRSKINEEAIERDHKVRGLSQSPEEEVEEIHDTLDGPNTDSEFENPEVFTVLFLCVISFRNDFPNKNNMFSSLKFIFNYKLIKAVKVPRF